jgi:hypothetical protein
MTDAPDSETFHLPLPAPPPGHPAHDVLFVRADLPREDREDEDILLRRVPRETAGRFRAGAGGRGLTHAQYLVALVALHARIRELADSGDAALADDLEQLGLSTVSI